MRAPWLALLLIAGSLAGCLSDGSDPADPDPATGTGTTSVFERASMPFNSSDPVMSHTLHAGQYGILPGIQFFAPLQLGPEEGVRAAAGLTDVSIGIHFPDIPGCDWTASDLPEQCHVPVIADVGPYYSATVGRSELQTEGDAPVTEYTTNRLMGTLVENFVPHGYAVAAVSVLGTGDSGHCMDLMGNAEQKGVQAAVDFLGSAAWSNGAVALIGRSYDGSTPWEAAMVDSPYLKTIVPISGLQGQHDLMWRNGSAEFRGSGLLYGLYAAMTIDGEPGDAAQVLCPDYLIGGPEGLLAYSPLGTAPDAAAPYWSERYFFDGALANYQGSVYYIHGMQDWNVDNHQAFPYYNLLLESGFEMKGLFGQWAHMYPDRANEHRGLDPGFGQEAYPESVRMDWTQDLLEWFDHYLKGTGPKPALHVEVQDNQGGWRVESEYPPQDAQRIVIELTEDQGTAPDPAPVAGAADPITGTGPITFVKYTLPALSTTEDTLIAGNVHLHATVTPNGPGGQLFALMRDADTGLRLGHAIMDLRYHQGGKDPVPVVPGIPIVAKMEFFAMDVVLPAGHEIEIELRPQGMDYMPSSVSNPVDVHKAGSFVSIPVVERSADVFFTPPGFESA